MMKNDDNLLLKREYYMFLFDYYGFLLTNKQQEYFNDFYINDYTLSEIASNKNISRSAVFDAIEKINKALEDYEKALGLFKKNQIKEKIFEEYMGKQGSYDELINKLKEIE